jgi:hypothetical protein
VMKVEITDKDGNVLTSPVKAASLATVARETALKAKVTPAGLKGLKYQWTVTGSAIKTYNHRTDIPAAHKEIDLTDKDKIKEDLSFFWTNVTDANKTAVTLKVTKDSTTCDATLDFTVKQDPDPSKNIYCKNPASPETNPNGLSGWYQIVESHQNWHIYSKMDNGKNPSEFTEDPVESKPEPGKGKANVWGDAAGVDLDTNGRAFLLWHKALMDSHFKWRDTFHVGQVKGAAPGAPDPQEYLKQPPDNNSEDRSRIYGYVRLGEFQNEWELGRDMDEPWHNSGHDAISKALGGDTEMGGYGSPGAKENQFWKWHMAVDVPRLMYKPDQAEPKLESPADKGKVAVAPTEVIITFNKRVSFATPAFDGAVRNKVQLTAGKLKLLDSKGKLIAATKLEDIGQTQATKSRFMVYKFSGFAAAPAAGPVTIELKGTASYKGNTWTFTIGK